MLNEVQQFVQDKESREGGQGLERKQLADKYSLNKTFCDPKKPAFFQKKLIHIHDVNLKYILDHKMAKKFKKNSEFIKDILVEEGNIKETLRKEKNFKRDQGEAFLEDADLINIHDIIFINHDLIDDLESELKQKFKVTNQEQYLYRKNRVHKRLYQEQKEKDVLKYMEYHTYIEMVWQSKNNKIAFIKIQNPQMLDQLDQVTGSFNVSSKYIDGTLMEIKRIVSNLRIYDQIDWQPIEIQSLQFKKKQETIANKDLVKFQREVDKLFIYNLNVRDDRYNIYPKGEEDSDEERDLYINPSEICLDAIKHMFTSSKIRLSPVCFNSILSIVPQFTIDYINSDNFTQRFEYVTNEFKFKEKHQKLLEQKDLVQKTQD